MSAASRHPQPGECWVDKQNPWRHVRVDWVGDRLVGAWDQLHELHTHPGFLTRFTFCTQHPPLPAGGAQ
jgi:hypothetical protein